MNAKILAAHRKAICAKRGCENNAECEDPAASCPGGCWGPERAKPGLVRRAVNFGTAVVKDVAAGRPRRAPEEIEAVLEICRGCPLFRNADESCSHPSCGCPVRKKASWKMEKCPLGKWS